MVIFIRRALPESDVWLKKQSESVQSGYGNLKTMLANSEFVMLFSREHQKTFFSIDSGHFWNVSLLVHILMDAWLPPK